ncbi:MAG: respiratory nitrate reductase subunit gamma [Proteobacteria bacterium]|nr:respiratory nitrate reductase subunit gamma [Pseudomonadota bacterium]MBU1386524.1 respiratory nitrate reductase subunit gamma [Pseudomonadota bacterium]MBU1544635.1 respiratory nitrate reductase subunit gamma [Pseudomonadota bacterium]MBU2429224.1 respiratory nitrate reductase subunit gamma [Pseudomonadota bacterium]MBU2481386.1 respiratory nitrate reductase subunit gamma [Pseudomonadota bacterium]
MHSFIQFITGPMVWISFGICFIGIVFRLLQIFRLTREKENFMFTFLSVKFSLRSILVWLVPFLPVSTRKSPVFYAVSYIFHILLFLTPLFLLSHVILIEENFNLSWWTVSDWLADIFTVAVICALIFFAIRRRMVPEVKFLTGLSDYVFIILVALPFISGFIAYHQFFAYQWMVIIHVISGELMLILIPFTRFFHMILAPLTRAYTASEFGGVRHSKDW